MQDKITLLNYDYSKWGIGEKVGQVYLTGTGSTTSDTTWFNYSTYTAPQNWISQREQEMFIGRYIVGIDPIYTTTGISINSEEFNRRNTLNYQREQILHDSAMDLAITGTAMNYTDDSGNVSRIPMI